MHPMIKISMIICLSGWMMVLGSLFAFMGYVLTDTSLTGVVAFGCLFYVIAASLIPTTIFIARDIWRQK